MAVKKSTLAKSNNTKPRAPRTTKKKQTDSVAQENDTALTTASEDGVEIIPEALTKEVNDIVPVSYSNEDIDTTKETLSEVVTDIQAEELHIEEVDKINSEEITPKSEKNKKKKSDKKKKTSKKKDSEEEVIVEDESFINKLQKKKKVSNKESLSVTLWEDLYNIIQQVQEITGQKQNSIVNHILSEVYDEKSKAFTIDIPAETKQKDKVTSFLIEEKHLKAIKKTANKLNMSSVSYFNKLILKYAEENILPDIQKDTDKNE